MIMIKETIIIIISILAVLCLFVFGVTRLSKAQCMAKYSNYEAEYHFLGGCRIVWNGKLTPVDIIREIN
jgi:hypothetical protein